MWSTRLPWDNALNSLAAAVEAHRASGREILDLTVSNPTAAGLGASAETLPAALSASALARYAPEPRGPRSAREAVAREYARLGASVDPERLLLTASSSESYAWLFKLLADPGDTVLVPEPSYPLFAQLAGLEGVRLRPYRLAFAGGEWHLDWSTVDVAGVRAVIAVNPNNPTGSFLRRPEWQRLSALAAERAVALIVDEVFVDYPLAPPADAVRTVAAEPPPPALTFALGGLSKSCGLPQMKLGWLAALGPDPLVTGALHRLELIADSYLSVGTPVLAALPGLLDAGAGVRAAIQGRIRDNRGQLAAAVSGSACTVLPTEAGWSAILRVPAIRSDEQWALALLADADVLVQPGYFFDLHDLGATIVISLLTPPKTLKQGIERLIRQVG